MFSRQTPEDGKGQPSQDPVSWTKISSCMVGTRKPASDQMLIPRLRGLLLLALQGSPYCVSTPLERGSYEFLTAKVLLLLLPSHSPPSNNWINLKYITPSTYKTKLHVIPSKFCKLQLKTLLVAACLVACHMLIIVCATHSVDDHWYWLNFSFQAAGFVLFTNMSQMFNSSYSWHGVKTNFKKIQFILGFGKNISEDQKHYFRKLTGTNFSPTAYCSPVSVNAHL